MIQNYTILQLLRHGWTYDQISQEIIKIQQAMSVSTLPEPDRLTPAEFRAKLKEHLKLNNVRLKSPLQTWDNFCHYISNYIQSKKDAEERARYWKEQSKKWEEQAMEWKDHSHQQKLINQMDHEQQTLKGRLDDADKLIQRQMHDIDVLSTKKSHVEDLLKQAEQRIHDMEQATSEKPRRWLPPVGTLCYASWDHHEARVRITAYAGECVEFVSVITGAIRVLDLLRVELIPLSRGQ